MFTPTKYEIETTINYNDAETEAYVYTCNKALIRKMDKLCGEYPTLIYVMRQDAYSKTYKCPKKLVKIGKPSILSSEERQRRQDKARETFGKQTEVTHGR